MKKNYLLLLLMLCTSFVKADGDVLSATSPEHRVSLLELYTSEGCSSCPPAEEFLSSLEKSGVSNQQLIPLAFHVTYWDKIGWRDPYGSSKHDLRQRVIAQIGDTRTVYTPQFVLNGADYRDYGHFSENVRKIILQTAKVQLTLNAENINDETKVELKTELLDKGIDKIAYFLVLYENKLSSDVLDGENEGKTLHHDYVVRKIKGPFLQNKDKKTASFNKSFHLNSDWKKKDIGLVAFAQNPNTGKILQSVELKLF